MQCRKPAARALSGGEAHWQGMLSRAAHAERKSAGYVTGFHGNRGTDPANYHRHQDTGDPGPPRPASVGHPGPIPAGPPSAVLPIRGNLPAPVSRRRASLGPEPADTFGGRRRVRRMTWPRTRWAADADLVIDDLARDLRGVEVRTPSGTGLDVGVAFAETSSMQLMPHVGTHEALRRAGRVVVY